MITSARGVRGEKELSECRGILGSFRDPDFP